MKSRVVIGMIIGLIVVVAFSLQIASANSLQDGLVARFAFDEGKGNLAYDKQCTLPAATISNGTWGNGPTGLALIFNGTNTTVTYDQAVWPLLTPLEIEEDITITLWFKTELYTSQRILYRYSYNLILTVVDDYVVIRWQTRGTNSVWMRLHSQTRPQKGEWYFLTALIDSQRQVKEIYINGELDATEFYNVGLQASPSNRFPLGIGVDPIANNQYFNGAISDVRIYNRPLSASEIKELYTTKDAQELEYKGIACYPSVFSEVDEVTFGLILGESQAFKVSIYDERGELIWTSQKVNGEEGYNDIVWDGRNNKGDIVPAGIYECVATSTDESTHILQRGIFVKTL